MKTMPEKTHVNKIPKRKSYWLRVENLDVAPESPMVYMDYRFDTLTELSEFILNHNKYCFDICEYKIRVNE